MVSSLRTARTSTHHVEAVPPRAQPPGPRSCLPTPKLIQGKPRPLRMDSIACSPSSIVPLFLVRHSVLRSNVDECTVDSVSPLSASPTYTIHTVSVPLGLRCSSVDFSSIYPFFFFSRITRWVDLVAPSITTALRATVST